MKGTKVTCESGPMGSLPHSCRGRIFLTVLILISLIAIAAGLLLPKFRVKRRGPTAFDEVGPGLIEGNQCTNDFFGFSIKFPQGWYTRSRASFRSYLEAQKEPDRQNSAPILFASKYASGVRGPGAPDPYLFVFAQRLSNMPGLRRTEEYLLACLKESEEENPGRHHNLGGPYKFAVGRQTLYRLDATYRVAGRSVNLSHLALMRRDYGFSIAIAWQNEEDERALKKALESVRFTQVSNTAKQGSGS